MSKSLCSNSPIWKYAVQFHGHACPGIAIGCRMALAAVGALGLVASMLQNEPSAICRMISPDEELVCVAETDACCIDAVQAILGCTIGKGNLLLKLRGKTAMSFYHRLSKKAVRMLWIATSSKPGGETLTRDGIMRYYLEAPEEDLLEFRQIPFNPPERAIIARSLSCSECGEKLRNMRLGLGMACLIVWNAGQNPPAFYKD